MPVELFPLGREGLMVPRIGLGVMSAAFYSSGDTKAAETASLEAIDELVPICAPNPCFLDSAWIYSHPTGLHSEEIVAKAVAKHGRSAFVIATKCGSSPAGKAPDSSTATIKAQYADSVRRLGCAPDLYYQHRPDPARDTAAVAADFKAMIAEGKFRYYGLSECSPAELRRAHAVHPCSAVQMEWSLAERGVESTLLPTARELGVGVVAYSPLSRGLLTGALPPAFDATDRRALFPRFQGPNLDGNVAKAARLAELAAAKGCTAAQLSLAWLLAQGVDVFPIPGTKTASRVRENMGALGVALSPEDAASLADAGIALDGNRYGPAMMALAIEGRLAAEAAAATAAVAAAGKA
jgi:aryl-alcohol dehydrogenase-like predicted oxidoreductase